MRYHLTRTTVLLLILVCFPGFTFCPESDKQQSQQNSWQEATLESVGINAEIILRASKLIEEWAYQGQRSLVIIKDGKLVFEAYYDGYDQNDLFRIYSISKSVTSILIGIALDNGYLKDENEPISKLLPQYSTLLRKEPKSTITLKNVLTMTPGFEWDEENYSFSDARNSHTQMNRENDWMAFVLSRPLAFNPGTRWVYNTGNSHLLGGILKATTGLHANEFAEKYLFDPLGIKNYKWNSDPMGYPCVGGSNGGLQLRTRDLAKFGQLILDDGKWKGKQIVSETWVKKSTAIHINATNISKYGYLWWRDRYKIKDRYLDAICGYGYGGQSLQIFPELNMVVTMTSWGRQPRAQTLPVLLKILNATVSK